MGRKIKDANLETREARRRLPACPEPRWRLLDRGLHLGYRRIAKNRPGTWTARRRDDRKKGKYAEERIGAADDYGTADNLKVFDFSRAQQWARDWSAKKARIDAGLEPERTGPYTVAEAMKDYLAWFVDNDRKSIRQTREAAERHIVPSLGERDIAKLTDKTIKQWLMGLSKAPARVRTGKGHPPKHRKTSTDDAKRQRKATANRILTVLKAALNHAWHDGKTATDEAWRKVKPFGKVDAPVIRYLDEAECARLVNASAPGFRPLVRAALLTGCRYGELTALRAADLGHNPDTGGTLLVRAAKSGKSRHVVLTDEGLAFFKSAVAGKSGSDLLFTRSDGSKWGSSHQQRPMLEACTRASIAPAVSFHILRHTHASLLARKGTPMFVIAQQLGHADTRLTEKHYAPFAPSHAANTIRANFPTLGILEESNVRAMDRRKAK